MPSFAKSPAELTRRFTALLPVHPDVEPRKMFGYACAFVRGNFWIGLHEANVVVRLPDGLHERVAALRGAPGFDPMGGRPMRGWFVVPPAVVANDGALRALCAETLALALTLPPKAAKGAKPARAPAKKAPAKKATAKKATAKKAPAKKATAKKAKPRRR